MTPAVDHEDPPTREGSPCHSDILSPVPKGKKRKKYTPVACDDCKKRKLKCDGERPCQRCIRLPSKCTYTPRGVNVEPDVSMMMKNINENLAVLQEQVKLLITKTGSDITGPHLTTYQAPLSPETSVADSITHLRYESTSIEMAAGKPQYMGPTSNAFSLGLATSSLQQMGMQVDGDHTDERLTRSTNSPTGGPLYDSTTKDALSFLSWVEANRLINLYAEECGTIYPFLELKEITSLAKNYYPNGSFRREPQSLNLSRDDYLKIFDYGLQILKMVLAVALVIEGQGQSDLGKILMEDAKHSVYRGTHSAIANVYSLQVFMLMSIYQFHCDEEILAWRTIGIAVRMALEMGLHRRETLICRYHDQEERLSVTKLFWCIYVLDRRWSFGVGMPFALHDLDIDPDLPEPDNAHPYLTLMISYGHIGSKVWKAMSGFGTPAPQIRKDKAAYLDFEITQWQKSIPPELLLKSDSSDSFEGNTRTIIRIRVLLHLRANQMKIHIHKRTLSNPATILADLTSSQSVVDIAKDTIHVLCKLNRLTDIYSSQQTCFNYFLVSALAVIFLAVCHATEHFNESCREEFYMALDLIKGFSATSYISRRLWSTIKHLKTIGPKLGILSQKESQRDGDLRNTDTHDQTDVFANMPTSTSIRHLPGTTFADSNSSRNSEFAQQFTVDSEPTYDDPMDGHQLSSELTSLFESFEPRDNSFVADIGSNGTSLNYSSFGADEELSRTLIDFF